MLKFLTFDHMLYAIGAPILTEWIKISDIHNDCVVVKLQNRSQTLNGNVDGGKKKKSKCGSFVAVSLGIFGFSRTQ